MHKIEELPAWERLFKKMVWQQIGDVSGKRILDFGSGEGITANHFAEKNEVVAIEPSEEMLKNRWRDYLYEQIVGDIESIRKIEANSFDMIICHNVLEYIDDKKEVIRELSRVLKSGGYLSLVKHNRAGRIMQMAVLLDDFEKAHALLDGKNSTASKFGAIRYYEDEDILRWVPQLELVKMYGIRTFWYLKQNQEYHGDEAWQEKMLKLEKRVSQIKEYMNIAFFHHLFLQKTEVE